MPFSVGLDGGKEQLSKLGSALDTRTFTTGSFGKPTQVNGGPSITNVMYDVNIPGEIGIKGALERQFLQTKNKLLPPWLRVAFPINSAARPLGYYRPLTYTVGVDAEMYGIEQFIATMGDQGFAKPSRFHIRFAVPALVETEVTNTIGVGTDIYRRLPMMVTDASFPSRAVGTHEDRRGTPLAVKKPHEVMYDDVTLTFRCSTSMNERRFFESWMNVIYNTNGNTFRYPVDYVADIYITQYDNTMTPTKKVEILNGYPTTLSDISLSYDATDQVETFTVTFAYQSWRDLPVH